MKTVLWTDNDCVLPNHGVAHKGKTIDLPDTVADEYVCQGKAEKPAKEKRPPRSGEEV